MAKKDDAKKDADVEKDDAVEDKKDKKKDKKKGKPDDETPKDKDEGGEGEEGAEDGAPKKSKKKVMIIGAAALVVLLAAGGGGYYFFIMKHESKTAAGEAGADKTGEKAIFYTLPEFLVNLNTGGKQVSYLKTTIVLDVGHQTDVPLIEANLPRLFDTLNTYMRELRASDLAGSAGIQRLREELLLRANKVLWPVKVNDVLFKEIVVQ